MDRRELLKRTGLVAGTAMSGNAIAGTLANGAKSASAQSNFISALGDCVASCERCVSHCISMLAEGKPEFQKTLETTRECLAVCSAMLTVSTFDAPHRADLAKLCIAVCEDCAKECDVHSAHSEICKECAQACRDCATACASLL